MPEKAKKDQICTFVCQLTKPQIFKLKEYLENQDYQFTEEKYTFLKAHNQKLEITVFLKGKLIIEGLETKEFVEQILEPKILADKRYIPDKKGNFQFRERIGVNEIGRNDYFGPLVITSIYMNKKSFDALAPYDDFKKDVRRLSHEKTFQLSEIIKKNCRYSIVTIGPERYNELFEKMGDMDRLLAWGHSRAIENILFKVECDHVIVNQFGDKNLIIDALMKKGKTIRLRQQHNAENDIAVAAAAIVSRAEAIMRMEQLGEEVKMELIRGNNTKVEKMAKELINRDGAAVLVKVCKLHFATTKRVILS